jgi:hypothetical protein
LQEWEEDRRPLIFGKLKYFPFSTTPATSTRVPFSSLKYLPTALLAEPNSLRARNAFTTTTRGELLSSSNEKLRPANSGVSAARK